MTLWEVQPHHSPARPHDCYDIYETDGDGLGIPGLENLDHTTAQRIVDAHNRWLAAHDREVAAGSLRDAADAFEGAHLNPNLAGPDTDRWRLINEVRRGLVDSLRARADQIEEGSNEE